MLPRKKTAPIVVPPLIAVGLLTASASIWLAEYKTKYPVALVCAVFACIVLISWVVITPHIGLRVGILLKSLLGKRSQNKQPQKEIPEIPKVVQSWSEFHPDVTI